MRLRSLSERREPLTSEDDGLRANSRAENAFTGPESDEMKTALLIMMFVASASPGSAADQRDLGQARWNESSHVNCETVRAYVAQVGLEQAAALARAAGMTAGQEWRARRCLAKKV
jgi:hypothetical protein